MTYHNKDDENFKKLHLSKEIKESVKNYKEFLVFWTNELRPHAEKCVAKSINIYAEMATAVEQNGELTEEQQDAFFDKAYEAGIGVVEFMSCHQIVEMIKNVDSDIRAFKNCSLSMLPVLNTFSDENFYRLAFPDDVEHTEDVKETIVNLKLLAEKIKVAFVYLKDVK